jgi:hypothetical protein
MRARELHVIAPRLWQTYGAKAEDPCDVVPGARPSRLRVALRESNFQHKKET